MTNVIQFKAWREGTVSDRELISQLIQERALLLDKIAAEHSTINALETELAKERLARSLTRR